MSWIEYCTEKLGKEPRLVVDKETGPFRDNGTFYRRCWTWFVEVEGHGLINHSVVIDRFARRYRISVSRHVGGYQLEYWMPNDPTDEELIQLVDMVWK